MTARNTIATRCLKVFNKTHALPALFLFLLIMLITPQAGWAEEYLGLPVLGTQNGYTLVDVRPILDKMLYQNSRAKSSRWTKVTKNARLVGIDPRSGEPKWGPWPSDPRVPAGVKMFSWHPKYVASSFLSGAAYYQNGKWVAVMAGASRESIFCAIADHGDGKYTPAGAMFGKDWAVPWSKTLPTLTVCISDVSDVMSVGVILKPKTTTPPSYPAAPNNTYQLINAAMTWTEARDAAKSRGGYLATITSPTEWANIQKQIGSSTLASKDFWIGATDESSEGNWKWVTGESWLYESWGDYQPNNAGGRQHYAHVWPGGKWDDNNNTKLSYYLLEFNGVVDPPDDDPPDEDDPSEVPATYRLIQANLTWMAARDAAVKQGGHLATFETSAQWDAMVSQIGSGALAGKNIWIGATDAASEGSWKWLTGDSVIYKRWATGQPNNLKKIQHYAYIMGTTGSALAWDDGANTALPYYILEIWGATPSKEGAATAATTALKRTVATPSAIPNVVLVSDHDGIHTNGWAAVDGDESTAWVGAEGAGGWWLAMGFAEELDVSDVTVTLGENSLADVAYLGSVNAKDWTDLAEALPDGPVGLKYLWLIFKDDESGRVPRVSEISITRP